MQNALPVVDQVLPVRRIGQLVCGSLLDKHCFHLTSIINFYPSPSLELRL
jgi:hypothetical protein